jgi:hypothetical protein
MRKQESTPEDCGVPSAMAGALGSLVSRRRHGHHDDAERKHRQSHEFENNSVHGDISPNNHLGL